MNMKLTNMKRTCLGGCIILICASFGAYAEESHMEQALKHTEAALKATDGKVIVEHAETARSHAKVADEHLDGAAKHLDKVIEHGKQGHVDLAKKAAEVAVKHLKAAQ
jgi:hypothetical protein